MRSTPSPHELRQELELRLSHGRCAYCGARATLGRPLTREHLIPRSKGGRRHDPRIIVPACARCNHRRGSQELVLFLLAQPRRIAALVDHLASLPGPLLRQVDIRVFSEIYAALWVLAESLDAGLSARARLRQLCGGRTVHRRRYAARRVLAAVVGRIGAQRDRAPLAALPLCRIPEPDAPAHPGTVPCHQSLETRLVELLAAACDAHTAEVRKELDRQLTRCPPNAPYPSAGGGGDEIPVEPEDRGRSRSLPRRLRVDRRRGRPPNRRAA